MQPRVHLLTLGVGDLGRARRFYEALGFQASSASQGDVVFFRMGGTALALYPRHELAKDAAVTDDGHGFDGVTLAQNLGSKAEVDAVLAEAVRAGARLVKPAADAFWGGYSGYFADPDGHLWEIAWNPFFPFATDGALALPE